MKTSFLLVIIVLAAIDAFAGEFTLVYRHGVPVADHQAGWPGHVDFATWVNDENVVLGSRSGKVICISLDSRRAKWSLDEKADVQVWSSSRKTKRLAYLIGNGRNLVSVVDCENGKSLFRADQDQLGRLLKVDSTLPSQLTLAPDDGRMILVNFSTSFGCNGYVLDPSYKKVLSSFHVDASPSELSTSPDASRFAVIADKDVLCVRELTADRDVYFRGERIAKEPASLTTTIDAPFFSHLRDGGGDTIVYTRDNSWATGQVFVRNIAMKTVKNFDARNGHIEIDVDFPNRRILLTGTSTDLTLIDFDGKELAHLKNATKQRNMCVQFSPDGQRVLVGSWDNTASIYRIVE